MASQPPSYPPPPIPTNGNQHNARPVTPKSGAGPPGKLDIPKNSKTASNGSAGDLSKSPTETSRSRSPLPTRRSSLGNLLRRSKSNDKMPKKKISKKHAQAAAAAPPVPQSPPRLPELAIQKSTPMRTFGGPADDNASSKPSSQNGNSTYKKSMDASRKDIEEFKPAFDINQDPYQNVSITNRGRYSYASSSVSTIHGPRRLRKRKDPSPFNILVVGARSSGKSSFVQFLKHSLAASPKSHKLGSNRGQQTAFNYTEELEQSFELEGEVGTFQKSYIETDIDGERVGITIWDSDGLEKSVADLQMREIVTFIEGKFEETFTEETRVSRIPGNKDSHIHCTFLLLDPAKLDTGVSKKIRRGPKSNKETNIEGLDEDLDLQVFRALNGKTTVIPVISKADTCTLTQTSELKKLVIKSLYNTNIDPLQALDLDLDYSPDQNSQPTNPGQTRRMRRDALPETAEGSDDESVASDDSSEVPARIPAGSLIPFSIISPDHYSSEVVGRQYAWGVADPYNTKHCDFVKLKEAIFSDWRSELREISREVWYENWRTSRLSKNGRQVNGIRH